MTLLYKNWLTFMMYIMATMNSTALAMPSIQDMMVGKSWADVAGAAAGAV